MKKNRRIRVGDTVRPRTAAGLCLSTEPCDGSYDRKTVTACVLRGQGLILRIQDIVIDYDSWPDSMYDGLGEVPYRNCLVQCDEGIGWAGEGALIIERRRK